MLHQSLKQHLVLIIRLLVVGVLSTAIVLKFSAIFPRLNSLTRFDLLFESAALIAELLLAVWFLLGFKSFAAATTGLVVFTGFAAYSFVLGILGRQTCGCFGEWKVSPWVSFTLDVVFVFLLAWLRLHLSGRSLVTNSVPFEQTKSPRVWLSLFSFSKNYAVFAALTFVVFAGIGAGVLVARPSLVSRLSGNNDVIILEPDKWVGKRFPLFDYVDKGDELVSDKWIVLLHDPHCPKCQERVAYYRVKAASIESLKRSRVALLEIPSYGHGDMLRSEEDASSLLECRLSHDVTWFAKTPVEFELVNGYVTQIL